MSEQQDMTSLESLVADIDSGADRLRDLMTRFESRIDKNGEFHPGVKDLWTLALSEEADAIRDQYERDDKKPPAEATLKARATRKLQKDNPTLFAEYHGLAGSIATGQKWLTNKREAMKGYQSLNKTTRELAGMQ